MDKFVGKRLDGRYEIQEIIGVGGMSVVYKAYDNFEDRIVAIKILKEEFVTNEEFLTRFKNESKAIAVLSHPNIVKVYDVSFGDLIQYIVMEYIDGITLKEYIARQGSLRWRDAAYFVIQILKGLQHAHDKGIIHRDIKPQNIMVLPDGTIKVTDFGIARFARSEQRTITDKAIGSVHYISPEQARGEKTDKKADIYSVGVMLYEMITGQLPFQAESAVSVAIMQLQRDPQLPTDINPSIPLGLEQITMHAMQKTPERRYQSAAEMLFDLEQFRKDPMATFEYPYFVDNQPTRYVQGINNTVPVVTPGPSTPRQQEWNEPQKKSGAVPILVGITIALFIVLIVLGIMFAPKLFSGTGAEIDCPKFIGMTEEQVKQSDYMDTFSIYFEYEKNDEFPVNEICNQSEREGKKLKKGAEITLTVSMGINTCKVPDIYGKTESYAISQLKADKFAYVIKEVFDDEVEAGIVIKTEPAKTTVVAEGTEVTVYVSKGKAAKMVLVPADLDGLSEAQARKLIETEGLVPKFEKRSLTTSDKSYMEKGKVISTEPEAATELLEGSEVIVYVSDGTVILDVKVTFPEAFATEEEVTLSLWVDGALKAESETLEAAETKNYTFKDFKATSKTVNATLKVGITTGGDTTYKEAAKLSIDSITGKVTVTSTSK